ncbi:hypothetical protein BC832DRAFT_552009 [Gaertneriomyces semiglobifer]|nr:hypothetical protein BC832DRAFT_552009 [Gaertneriomyces semiglobifer]
MSYSNASRMRSIGTNSPWRLVERGNRCVCTATAYQPVFYRDVIRVPKPRRKFPLWQHQVVERTILPPNPAQSANRENREALMRRKQLDASKKRLPGWEGMLQALAKSGSQHREQRSSLTRGRRKSSRYHDPEEIFAPIATLRTSLPNIPTEQQQDAITKLYFDIVAKVAGLNVSSDEYQPALLSSTKRHEKYHPAVFPTAVAKLVKVCARMGKLQFARNIVRQYVADVQHFPRVKGEASLVMGQPYHALIQALSRLNLHEEIVQALDEMRENGIRPTTVTYNVLIRSCGVERTDQALAWLRLLIESEDMRPNLGTLNHLLRLTFEAGPSYRSTSQSIFEMLLRLYPSKPGCRSGPSGVTAAILLSQCRNDREIEGIFRDMQRWSLLRSPLAQQELLRATARTAGEKNALSACLDWINRLHAMGVPLSINAARVLLENYILVGAPLKGFSFVERLRERGIKIDDDGLTAILHAIGRYEAQGRTRHIGSGVAWSIWNKLRHDTEAPSPKALLALIEALGREKDVHGLWYLYELFKKKSLGSTSAIVETRVADVDPESALLARIDPSDPRLHRTFLRAFGAADPNLAVAAFTEGPKDEHAALSLLHGVRDRQEAAALLSELLGVALKYQAPLTKEGLIKSLTGILERSQKHGYLPMAFSSATVLDELGAWNREAVGVGSQVQVKLVRDAVVQVAAQGIADAAESIRSGADVPEAIGLLQRWCDGDDISDAERSVKDALQQLEQFNKSE